MNYSREEISAILRHALDIEEDFPAIIPVKKGASQRLFYRICFRGGKSVIFMEYGNDRRENNFYAAISRFLGEIGIPVPEIFYHEPDKRILIMEDLGEKDLWSCRQEPWERRKIYYLKVLYAACRLHSFRRGASPLTEPPMMEAFDFSLYRWEHAYFMENFVTALCRIEMTAAEAEALGRELDQLACAMTDATPCLIHRDLQSQNLMLHEEAPFFIDFQGMRYGNPLYDLGSLIYDPYVPFTERQRDELVIYYYDLCPKKLKRQDFVKLFRQASAQRLMQALGAYGFLGLQKGRQDFLVHIPAGLNNLIDATQDMPDLALLGQLAMRCRDVVNSSFFTGILPVTGGRSRSDAEPGQNIPV